MYYKHIFKRLPERFRKNNTEKLYYVLFDERGAFKDAIKTVKDSRNIDKAKGKTLDLIGANVGQFRNGEGDSLFRQLIKVRIIANMSIGDIKTINTVTSILVKEIYQGLKEAWTEKEWDYEPSAIVINLAQFLSNFPYKLINQIKAAGVRILFETNRKQNIYYAHYAVVDREKTMYQKFENEPSKEQAFFYAHINAATLKEVSFLFPNVNFVKKDGWNLGKVDSASENVLYWGEKFD